MCEAAMHQKCGPSHLRRIRTRLKKGLVNNMKARLPKGMGGGPTNMQGMLKQAQKMQEEMTALQEDLNGREYDIQVGGGAVSIKINGKLEILSINIDPDIVDPDDVETLSDILTAGFNEAIKKVNSTNNEEMERITGSINMPGIPGLF